MNRTLCTDTHARRLTALGTMLALGLGGCSGAPQLPAIAIAADTAHVDGSPVEIYSRIARGANGCWFAPRGPLAGTHIFHADVEPPAQGGAAEIVVHERDPQQAQQWGKRAYRVGLASASLQTAVQVENLRLPVALAAQMRTDVFGWAGGGSACTAGQGGTGLARPAPETGSLTTAPKSKAQPPAKASTRP